MALWNLVSTARLDIGSARESFVSSDRATEMRTYAAGALEHLSVSPENQALIAEAGGVMALVSLLSDPDREVRSTATRALSKMVGHDAACIDAASVHTLNERFDAEMDPEIKSAFGSMRERLKDKAAREKDIDHEHPAASRSHQVEVTQPARSMPEASLSSVRIPDMPSGSGKENAAAGDRMPEVKRIPISEVRFGRSLGRGGLWRSA